MGLQPEHGEAYDRAAAEADTASADAPVYSFVGPTIFNLVNMNPARAAGVLFAHPSRRGRPGRPEILRGFLESVAFAVRANLEQLRVSTGAPVRRLTASGGMIRGKLFRRLLAEVMPVPVDVSTVVESSLVGCAVLAGLGSGTYADLPSAVREAVRVEQLVPEEVGRHEERYRKWRELHETLERVNIP
jgi:sugar (pentulose or hexulose) kinase